MKILFKHAHLIVDQNKEYIDGALLVDGEKIIDAFPQSDKVEELDEYKVIDLKGKIVMPGFFDTHCHGIKKISYDSCSLKEFDEASLYLARTGTTSFIPSISYDYGEEEMLKQIGVLDKAETNYARYMGMHLEGPFLSKKHLGMGDPNKFITPDISFIHKVLNLTDKMRQMTIAIELDGALECIKLLKENNVRVMIGHSDALMKDLNEDVDGFTHLFNAMRSLHHRDLTLVNAAFTNKYFCELIADGNHVDRQVLKLVIKNIDRNKIVLISDSSIAQGLEDGEYTFISKKCTKKGTKFISFDGHYAGSVVSINDCMKVLKELGADYTDLLAYSSLNAHRLYGDDNLYGSLYKGKYADIVIMDDELNIENVYCRGKFVYE